MKKLFLIVAAMFAVVSFSACSDDDDNKIDPNQIAGTWQITLIEGWSVDNDGIRDEWSDSYPAIDDDDYYWTYTFDGHGKMKRVSYTNQSVNNSTNGTYTVSNNVLTIVEKDGDYEETQEFQIKKLTSSQLILFEHRIDPEFTEEDTYTYKRVNWWINGQTCAKGLIYRPSAQVCPFLFRVTDFVKRLIYKTLLQSLSLFRFVYFANNLIFIKINND